MNHDAIPSSLMASLRRRKLRHTPGELSRSGGAPGQFEWSMTVVMISQTPGQWHAFGFERLLPPTTTDDKDEEKRGFGETRDSRLNFKPSRRFINTGHNALPQTQSQPNLRHNFPSSVLFRIKDGWSWCSKWWIEGKKEWLLSHSHHDHYRLYSMAILQRRENLGKDKKIQILPRRHQPLIIWHHAPGVALNCG